MRGPGSPSETPSAALHPASHGGPGQLSGPLAVPRQGPSQVQQGRKGPILRLGQSSALSIQGSLDPHTLRVPFSPSLLQGEQVVNSDALARGGWVGRRRSTPLAATELAHPGANPGLSWPSS